MGSLVNATQEIRLINILDQAGERPFEWGQNDCNTLALEWLDAINGTNWIKKVKGSYSDKKSAIVRASQLPKWSDGLVDEGWVEITPNEATVGDIAIVDGKHYDMAHIVMGSHAVSLHETDGMVKIPLDTIEARFFRGV
jgi:hypothetical protein